MINNHIPPDHEINRNVGEFLGWRLVSEAEDPFCEDIWENPDGDKSYTLPNFCSDRNALPILWKCLEKVDKQFEYVDLLGGNDSFYGTLYAITASPRRHCLVFLKAVDKWPEEWNYFQSISEE